MKRTKELDKEEVEEEVDLLKRAIIIIRITSHRDKQELGEVGV